MPFPLAISTRARLGNFAAVKLDVPRERQIELAIKVVVEERAAGVPADCIRFQPSRFRDVFECPIAFVVIKHAVTVISDEQVLVAIVVVIADASALSPSHLSQAGFLRDIHEMHVSDIAIKMAGGILAATLAVHGGRIDQQNVHQAIVVEIENRNPVAGGFEDVAFVVRISGNIFRR